MAIRRPPGPPPGGLLRFAPAVIEPDDPLQGQRDHQRRREAIGLEGPVAGQHERLRLRKSALRGQAGAEIAVGCREPPVACGQGLAEDAQALAQEQFGLLGLAVLREGGSQ